MSENIKSLPTNGFAPTNDEVVRHLREIADWVKQGEYGDVHTIVMLIEDEDGLVQRRTCGKPCDIARVVGLLTFSATQAVIGLE